MTPITAKAGDAIRIEKQLTDGRGRDGSPVDLTNETVRVYIQYEDDTLVANQEVEYVDRENGKVAAELQPSQTSNIGRHDIEWVVDPQADPTTYPGDSYDTLRTESPLDRELTVSEETPPDLTVTTLTVEGDADLTGGNLTGVGTLEAESVDAINALIETIQNSPDLDSNDFENVGHDRVDVPQVRNLTVDDFESGALSGHYKRSTDQYSVQSTTASEGDYALKADPPDGSGYPITASTGLEAFPQAGDTFTYQTYATDTNHRNFTFFGLDSERIYNSGNGYVCELQFDSDTVQLCVDSYGNDFASTGADLSSHLNEWLTVTINWGEDGTITATVEDSTGSVIASLSGTNTRHESGGIGFRVWNNGSTGSPMYWDGLYVARRVGEYTSETQKGTTELGNEVTPSGAVHTGPQEAPTNALRAEYATAPVNDEATQGEQSLLTLLKSGVNPALYMERTFDGQGGAYGHQLQTALGRFARINANLSWEYDSLVDVPNWDTDSTTGYAYRVTGYPRRLEIEDDGSTKNNSFITSSVLTAPDSLTGYTVTWKNVAHNETPARLVLGLESDSDLIKYERRDGLTDVFFAGGTSDFPTNVDWSQNHDVTFAVLPDEVQFYIDGVLETTISYSGNDNFTPRIGLLGANTGVTTTGSVETITVEPLPEVLN